MEDMNFLQDLIKISPVVAVLAWALWWLKGRVEKKEEDIAELNKQLRESEKTALECFSRITEVLKQLSMDVSISNKDIVNELRNLKDFMRDNLSK